MTPIENLVNSVKLSLRQYRAKLFIRHLHNCPNKIIEVGGIIQYTYKIVNKVNNKFYYGRTYNIKQRWNNHRRLLDNNSHFNIHLQRSWNKYGKENFNFLIHKIWDTGDPLVDLEEAQNLEQEVIDMLYKSGIIYNRSASSITGVLKGEDHPNYNKPPSEWMSEEGWKRTMEFHKNRDISGENNPFYGKTHTEETKKILSVKCANYGETNGFYGKQHTDETKKKISEFNKGKYIGENNPFYGKSHSEETKKILAETARKTFKGKPKSEEQKQKMRKNNVSNIKVMINGIIYDSYTSAQRETGEDRKKISYRANSELFPNYKIVK